MEQAVIPPPSAALAHHPKDTLAPSPQDLPFNPTELKEKYTTERTLRLQRPQGNGVEQYIPAPASYLSDPWAPPNFTRAPVTSDVSVAIIGGGYGAQLAAVELLKAGTPLSSLHILEKAADFGGTWYWNRYPGAHCDIESYLYMPLLEETGYVPSEKYAKGKELLEHAQRIGRHFDLYSRALFQTEVTSLRWGEEEGKWNVSTSRGDSIKAKFVITAGGPLHRPKLPGLEGLEKFKGKAFHSSRWDYGYTGGDSEGALEGLKGKRVGIIGTGATGVQIVPQLGEWAEEVYVFQRTPSAIHPRLNKPTDAAWAKGLGKGWQQKRLENFEHVVSGEVVEEDMVQDSWTDVCPKLWGNLLENQGMDPAEAGAKRQIVDYETMEKVRKRVDEMVEDKETAEKLKPWYNAFCKRPCFHDEYLPAFNRPNVKLVDTKGNGVERLTEKGVVANGEVYEVDCLIYATGFEFATAYTHKQGYEVYGRNGLTLSEKWGEGASTLHAWTTNGFPNCFFVQVSQGAITPNFVYPTAQQAKHIAFVIGEAKKRGVKTLEASKEGEEQWTKTIFESLAGKMEFISQCTPAYGNNEGRPSMAAARNAPYGGGILVYVKILEEWRAKNEFAGLDIVYAEGKEAKV